MTPPYFDTPQPAPPAPRKYSSIPVKSHEEKLIALRKLRVSSRVKTRNPLKRRAKKRDRNDKARIYGPETFVTFLHQHQCLGCGSHRVEQAHRFTGGTGRKDNWQRTIPLCGPRNIGGLYPVVRGCHASYDAAKQTWSRDHNLPARAAHIWNLYLLHCGRLGVDPETGKPNA